MDDYEDLLYITNDTQTTFDKTTEAFKEDMESVVMLYMIASFSCVKSQAGKLCLLVGYLLKCVAANTKTKAFTGFLAQRVSMRWLYISVLVSD